MRRRVRRALEADRECPAAAPAMKVRADVARTCRAKPRFTLRVSATVGTMPKANVKKKHLAKGIGPQIADGLGQAETARTAAAPAHPVSRMADVSPMTRHAVRPGIADMIAAAEAVVSRTSTKMGAVPGESDRAVPPRVNTRTHAAHHSREMASARTGAGGLGTGLRSSTSFAISSSSLTSRPSAFGEAHGSHDARSPLHWKPTAPGLAPLPSRSGLPA